MYLILYILNTDVIVVYEFSKLLFMPGDFFVFSLSWFILSFKPQVRFILILNPFNETKIAYNFANKVDILCLLELFYM